MVQDHWRLPEWIWTREYVLAILRRHMPVWVLKPRFLDCRCSGTTIVTIMNMMLCMMVPSRPNITFQDVWPFLSMFMQSTHCDWRGRVSIDKAANSSSTHCGFGIVFVSNVFLLQFPAGLSAILIMYSWSFSSPGFSLHTRLPFYPFV